MKPITVQDIARYFDGEPISPREEARIMDALEDSPELAALADLLADREETNAESLDADLSLWKRITSATSALRHTRLWHIGSFGGWAKLAEGQPVTTQAMYGRNGHIEELALKLSLMGKDQLILDVACPDEALPSYLVLAQFEFAQNRVPFVKDEFRLPITAVIPQSPTAAAAQNVGIIAAAAGGAEARDSQPKPSFDAEFVRGGGLSVQGRLREGENEDLVIATVDYNKIGGKPSQIRHVVTLKWYDLGKLGLAEVNDFPWPTDAVRDRGCLTIRPLEVDDLPLLSPEQVSALFGTQPNVVSLPISWEAGSGRVEFRYPSERRFALEPQTSWLLRVAETGKEDRSNV